MVFCFVTSEDLMCWLVTAVVEWHTVEETVDFEVESTSASETMDTYQKIESWMRHVSYKDNYLILLSGFRLFFSTVYNWPTKE
jgi:hypothetical protein